MMRGEEEIGEMTTRAAVVEASSSCNYPTSSDTFELLPQFVQWGSTFLIKFFHFCFAFELPPLLLKCQENLAIDEILKSQALSFK